MLPAASVRRFPGPRVEGVTGDVRVGAVAGGDGRPVLPQLGRAAAGVVDRGGRGGAGGRGDVRAVRARVGRGGGVLRDTVGAELDAGGTTLAVEDAVGLVRDLGVLGLEPRGRGAGLVVVVGVVDAVGAALGVVVGVVDHPAVVGGDRRVGLALHHAGEPVHDLDGLGVAAVGAQAAGGDAAGSTVADRVAVGVVRLVAGRPAREPDGGEAAQGVVGLGDGAPVGVGAGDRQGPGGVEGRGGDPAGGRVGSPDGAGEVIFVALDSSPGLAEL